MKKVTLLCVLLACMLAGCGETGEQSANQQQQEEEKQLYAENFYYADTANCGVITADANGLLYTATYGNRTQYINIYDLNGTCIGKKSLGVSTGGAQFMEVSEGMLYLLVPELDCMYVLYEIDTTTWQARYVYSFDKYTYVDNLVRIGDYVYVMGRVSNPKSKEYEQYSADVFYMYNGEVISRLSVTAETPEPEVLPIDFPVDIFSTANNTLGVYGKRKQKQVLDITTGKVKHLVAGENYLYLLGPDTDCANVLYQIDLTTWEAKRLYTFTEFEDVLEVVLLGDTIYVLAEYASVEEKEFINYEDWYQWSEGEKRIVAYLHTNEETPELAVVPRDLPLSIFKLTDTTLGIYAMEEHTEEKSGKMTILEYSPTENTFEAWPIAHYTSVPESYRSFLGHEDGVLMLYNSKQWYYVDRNGTKKNYSILVTIFLEQILLQEMHYMQMDFYFIAIVCM